MLSNRIEFERSIPPHSSFAVLYIPNSVFHIEGSHLRQYKNIEHVGIPVGNIQTTLAPINIYKKSDSNNKLMIPRYHNKMNNFGLGLNKF